MFTTLDLKTVEVADERRGVRYSARGHVELRGTRGGVAGDLINISASGAAIRCYGAVFTGAEYTIDIAGLGNFPCTIVRTFSGHCYGVRFNIGFERLKRLDKRLTEMFADKDASR